MQSEKTAVWFGLVWYGMVPYLPNNIKCSALLEKWAATRAGAAQEKRVM